MNVKSLPPPVDPDLIVFGDGILMTVTVSTPLSYFTAQAYNPGVYTVEVRAMADNNYDTGKFEELTVTILDPCITATLTIDSTIFLDFPEQSLVQTIGSQLQILSWTDSIIQTTI